MTGLERRLQPRTGVATNHRYGARRVGIPSGFALKDHHGNGGPASWLSDTFTLVTPIREASSAARP